MQAIYTAATGLKGQQTRLDTVAANISNVSTAGYKAKRVDFKDALYTAMDAPLGDAQAANLLTGVGVLTGATATDFSDGTRQETGQALDFSITGEGFFTVQNAGGEILYTRNGNFSASQEETGSFLITAQGYYVLDDGGNRISLPQNPGDIGVTAGGMLTTLDGPVATMGIAAFDNPKGLEAAGDSCFRMTEGSGPAVPASAFMVEQGALEGSNVNLADELTMLIRSQRAYSLASRALKTADEMMGLANQMR